MKKKKTILSLALVGTLALGGGSTLVTTQQTNMENELLSALNRIENYANMTYDFNNPANMFLNDDYFLFFNNGNYEFSRNDTNFTSTPQSPANTNNNEEMDYNSSQNKNNDQYYVLRNTTPQTNTKINDSSTPNSQNTNNQTYDQSRTLTNENSTINDNVRNATNNNFENQNSNNQVINSGFDYNTYSPSIQTINQSLTQNIQNLKQSINKSNKKSNQTIRFYTNSLNNLASKLESNQQELVSNMNRQYIMNTNQNFQELQNITAANLKATLKSRIIILECANETIIGLNNMLNSNENSSQNENLTEIRTEPQTEETAFFEPVAKPQITPESAEKCKTHSPYFKSN